MGRGQDSLARDQFSEIFGDRRGSSRKDDWEGRGEGKVVTARWREHGITPQGGVVFLFPLRFMVGEGTSVIAKLEKIFEVSESKRQIGALQEIGGGDMIYVLRPDVISFPDLQSVADTLALMGSGQAEVMIPERWAGTPKGSPQRMLLRPSGSGE